MYCPKCETVSHEGNFCWECGTKTILSKFLCPHCDASNYVTAGFCEHCGKPIQQEGKAFIDKQLAEQGISINKEV